MQHLHRRCSRPTQVSGTPKANLADVPGADEQTGTPLATHTLDSFNGAVIAERNSADGSLVYLHGDHLGSVAAATTASEGWPAARSSTPGARCAAAA